MRKPTVPMPLRRIVNADVRVQEAVERRDNYVVAAVELGYSYGDICRATGIAKSSLHAIVSRSRDA